MGLTPQEQKVIDAVPTGLWIGGESRPATGGGTFAVIDPSTEQPLVEIADGTVADALAALGAASSAQSSWAAVAPRERGEILRRSWQLMHERIEDLALLMTLEMGKSLAESRAEIVYAAEFFRWFSEEAVRIGGELRLEPGGAYRISTSRRPVGPAVLVTPWNFPAAMGTRKIGPAVAAGCTMVVKPAGETPLSMLALAALMKDAGLPDSVLNVVTSRSSGDVVGALLEDARARKLSFTGSTPVGRTLMKEASTRLLRVSLELGGNAPFIVMEDADLDLAVEGAVAAKMRNVGESCVAANRFLVHSSLHDEFASRLAARMSALVVGRGTEDGVDVGPLINAKQRDSVASVVADAVSRGARVLCGGPEEVPAGQGYYYPPTVLVDVAPGSLALTEEIFGPVAPIVRISSEAEALSLANGVEYGLASYLFTRDLGRALRMTDALEFGMVGVNRGVISNPAAPFGGVKQSGMGKEGGSEGIEEYLTVQYAALSG